MNGYNQGANEGISGALTEVIVGFACGVILNALAPQIPTIYLLAIGVANGVATLKLLDNIPRWSLGYLIGWIIGVVIILQSGVIDWSGLIVYFVVPVLVFIYRIYEILSG